MCALNWQLSIFILWKEIHSPKMLVVLERDDHALCRATNKSQLQKPGRFLMSGKGFVHLSLHCFMWMILHLKSWSGPTIVFFNSWMQNAGKELLFPLLLIFIEELLFPPLLLFYCEVVYWSKEVSASQGVCFM